MRRWIAGAMATVLAGWTAGYSPSAGANEFYRHNRTSLPANANTTDDPRRIPLPQGAFEVKGTIVLSGGRLFDGTGSAARPATIVVRGKRIAAILPAGSTDFPKDARVLALAGKTVMPGLIEMHAHLSYPTGDRPLFDEEGASSEADATLRAIERLRFYAESGITSVRDVSSEGMVPFRLKQWVNESRLAGPRVFAAGTLITGIGGHGGEGLADIPHIYEVSGPEEFRRAVRQQFQKGADLIKLASHFSQEEVKAAVTEAHELGMRVTVDAENEYIARAVEAGVDMVEHPLPRDDETIRQMAARNVGSIPTLVPYVYIVDEWGGYFGSTSRRFPISKEAHLRMLKKLRQAGVKLGVGTDLVGNWYRFLPAPYINELKSFVAAGFSNSEALVAATRTNAELLDMEDKLGTIEPGKLADIVVLDGQPDVRLDDLAKVDLVIRNGVVIVEAGRQVILRHVPDPEPTAHAKQGAFRDY